MTGIYKITSPSNKLYIGQSINIENRWKLYRSNPKSFKSQTKLYNSIIKHGVDFHIFEVIEECEENMLLERETFWKNYYKVLDIPSLCCRIDGKGGRNSKETNEKIKESRRLNPLTEEIKKKIGDAHRGLKYSDESKDKISKSKIGHKCYDDEWKLKISQGMANMDPKKKKLRKKKLKLANKNKPKPEGFGDRISKPIAQYDHNDVFIKNWKNVKEILLNINKEWDPSYIQDSCRGKRKMSYGFIWKYI